MAPGCLDDGEQAVGFLPGRRRGQQANRSLFYSPLGQVRKSTGRQWQQNKSGRDKSLSPCLCHFELRALAGALLRNLDHIFFDFRVFRVFYWFRATEVKAGELQDRLVNFDCFAVDLFVVAIDSKPSIEHKLPAFRDVLHDTLTETIPVIDIEPQVLACSSDDYYQCQFKTMHSLVG
jgi:hypothetical protein